jgi:hypothetical protein
MVSYLSKENLIAAGLHGVAALLAINWAAGAPGGLLSLQYIGAAALIAVLSILIDMNMPRIGQILMGGDQ